MPAFNKPTAFGKGVVPGGAPLPFGIGRDARTIFLNPRIGSDNNAVFGGPGTCEDPAYPLATATKAEDLLTDEQGDVIYWIASDSGTGDSSRDTGTITWDKGGCAMIGVCSPVHVSQRARIAPSTSFAGSLLTVSGNNNYFENLQLFQGHNAESHCLTVSGDRNTFVNCHIAGIGHATAGDDAASDSLILTGDENRFINCTIGLDTIARSAAATEIRCSGAAARNEFIGCRITTFCDAATPTFVNIGSGGIDRYIRFTDCEFFNPIDSTSTAMTVGMTIHASAGGTVILSGKTMIYGATDWASDFTNTAIALHGCDAAGTMGIAINGT